MSAVVTLDRPAPHVARLLINRPDKRNAIDHEVRETLYGLLGSLQADTQIRALVIGGAGGFFSAGGDTPSMVGLTEAQARERMRHIHRLCRAVLGLCLPVVTAIEGMGVGAGVGLALLGDVIVVGPGTKIYFPFLKLGLIPDWGSLLTLPRRIGATAAQQLLAASATVDGTQARDLGMADLLMADDAVMSSAIEHAEELARLPREAYARMKQMLKPAPEEFDRAFKAEEDAQAALLLSEDFREGYAAMREKRAADFVRGST
jgi:2-(1,2-epoxy-1,2-dihydrophenyl)acetyl-CoA isomerase